ncbi:gamma-glutamyltransferase [Parvibaculum sp.]|uniref:gamma-glutamyltransferase n=1 Tax=Parvibaculum sp. TaxID=2024848 RepID=UPI001B027FF2|nr:gamma-glutamyltransferase [Parvibaculum sp.]MBO6635510.1 gamma-glutamyltransferase [Parvibaculum sp.]MBO6677957.1 gamma-glutamyltransferase [Parvibaculum sp.]MBO6683431.1 gamma-glutamyltransferase [Parvibaculum sp.]MBO6904980.1 gamma-glutamyltransferase [Parvibaculum sp.]
MRLNRILPGLTAAALVLIVVVAGFAWLWRSDEPQPFMIAAANPYASEAGAAMLRKGGSAVDAAIAVQAVLSLVEPESSGLAGGAFMLHYDEKSGDVAAYDGRETAPMGATPALFLDNEGEPLPFLEAMIGGSSVGTPGVVKMLWLAHQEHGKLEWGELFQPAIKLAEEGFTVAPKLAEAIARDPVLMQMPVAQDYFYRMDANGLRVPAAEGDVLKNPAYAETLKIIAAEGWKGFYQGKVAEEIVSTVQNAPRRPGTLALSDFAAYEAKKREPICAPYRAYRVCSMPPPTSGGLTTLQILGILGNYDLKGMGPMTLTAVHFIAEAEKLAYADRDKYIGDPDFVDVPVEEMLDSAYLESRANEIDASYSMGKAKPGRLADERAMNWGMNQPVDMPSTSHFSILDSNGNAVSMTTSVEGPFGSHLMAGGMMLNNQLTDFSFVPEQDGKPIANAVAPGKRPRSSMTPVIVFDEDGEFRAAIGSPGGSRIIGYVTQTLIALIDWDMDMVAAVGLPRFLDRNGPLEIEAGTPLEQMALQLEELGHTVEARPAISGLHGILVMPDGLDGAADPRRDGNVVTGQP